MTFCVMNAREACDKTGVRAIRGFIGCLNSQFSDLTKSEKNRRIKSVIHISGIFQGSVWRLSFPSQLILT